MSKLREWGDILWRLGIPMSAVALIFLSLQFAITSIISTKADLIAPNGMPLGGDFLSLWSAGWLALTGNAAGAYDPATIKAVHQMVVPATDALTLFHYPPTFLLMLWPFAQLPYLTSWAAFIGFTGIGFLWVLWRARPRPSTFLLVLAYPATWLNILSGQNAFLTTLLLGLALLSTTPWIKGFWFGLLTYKPQLGLPIPFALLAGKRWMVIWNAGFSALLLAWYAFAAFGPAAWQAFVDNSPQPLLILAQGRIPLDHMVSAFAMVLSLNGSVLQATIAQGIIATIAFVSVMAVWKNPKAPERMKGAVLCVSILMATPHLFNYDLAILALPLCLWLTEIELTQWFKGEGILLVALWLAPFYALPSPELTYINLYPFLFIILQLFLLKRLKCSESLATAAPTN